jgi:hypothetical protein
MERIFCSKFKQAYGFVGYDIFWVLLRNAGQQCLDILHAIGTGFHQLKNRTAVELRLNHLESISR